MAVFAFYMGIFAILICIMGLLDWILSYFI